MLWKILTFVGVALAIWAAVRRVIGGPASQPPVRRTAQGEIADLERCPACGAWTERADRCACRTPPVP